MTQASGRWHGPESVLGALVGCLVTGLPYMVSIDHPVQWWLWLISPIVGLFMIGVAGPIRRVGVGLVASGLALPVAVALFFLVVLIANPIS